MNTWKAKARDRIWIEDCSAQLDGLSVFTSRVMCVNGAEIGCVIPLRRKTGR